MDEISLEEQPEQSRNISWRTLLVSIVFGLLGISLGLYAGLILLIVNTTFYISPIIATSLLEEMAMFCPEFKSIGGILGYLGKIHDTAVFLPFFLILLFILIVIYIRKRRRAWAANRLIKKQKFPLLFFSLFIILTVGLIFCWLKYLHLTPSIIINFYTLSTVINFGSTILALALFASLSVAKFGEASRRRPVLTILAILVVGGLLYLVNSTLKEVGDHFLKIPWLVLLLVCILDTLILFLLMGERGLISLLAGEKWELRSLLLRGMIVSIFFFAVIVAVKLFGEYLLKDISTLGEAGEPTRLSFQRLSWGMAIGVGSSLAVLGGVFAVMIPLKVKKSSRIFALTVPFFFLALLWGAGFLFKSYCSTVWEMDKGSLNEAASLIRLPDPPNPRIALLLKDVKEDVGSEVKIRDSLGSPSPTEVDLIPENMIRIENYLQARSGRWTFFTDDAQEARRTIALKHWLMDDFREIALKNSLQKGSVINSELLLVSIQHSPVTSENRRILEKLSDERFFVAIGKSCLRMAQAWVAMGEPERAEMFYECTKRSLKEKAFKGFTLLDKPVFTEGKVMGQIIGEVTTGARVGLFRLDEKEELRDVLLGGGFHYRKLKTAKDVREDGTFLFEYIPEGRYFLGLLLKAGVKGPFDIKSGGIFVVNRSNSSVNVGRVHIVKSPQSLGPNRKD